MEVQEIFNYGIYSSCYEAAKQMEQERIKQGLREHKPVTAGCDDFHCCFVGTKLCITERSIEDYV